MKYSSKINLFLLTVIAAGLCLFSAVTTEAGTSELKLLFKAPDYEIKKSVITGLSYKQVVFKECAYTNIPGEPAIPFKSFFYELDGFDKAEIETAGIEKLLIKDVFIEPSDSLENINGRTVPVPVAGKKEIYSNDSLFPADPLDYRVVTMRGKKYLDIRFYPLQYNPVTSEAVVNKSANVVVKFLKDNGITNGGKTDARSMRGYGIGSMESANDRLKVEIKEEGIYIITYSELVSAGIDPSAITPSNIKVTNSGEEISITIKGGDDGTFDEGDGIIFYAVPYRDLFTEKNVYYVEFDDSSGKRIQTEDGVPVTGFSYESYFYSELRFEENNKYWMAMPDGEGKDHWFWARLSAPENISSDAELPNPYTAESGVQSEIKVYMHGRTSTSTEPDHHTKVYINDDIVSDSYWDGDIAYTDEAVFSTTLLSAADYINSVKLSAVGDTGSVVDGLYLDYFTVRYPREFVTVDGILKFGVEPSEQAARKFMVSGFTSQNVYLWDISDPMHPVSISYSTSGSEGSYSIEFERIISETAIFISVEEGRENTPLSIVKAANGEDLSSASIEADYVVIGPEGFEDAVSALTDKRELQGFKCRFVDVEDIYDQFSYGFFTPQAIQDFLKSAYENWTLKPEYVLIVGDASIDYKDYLETGKKNDVPTFPVETPFGEALTDNRFVCVDGGDVLPDISIGRIPASTVEEVEIVLNKIESYENNNEASWWNKALFIADDETEFEEHSDDFAKQFTDAGYYAEKIYQSKYENAGNARDSIVSEISKGVLIANYTGHGSTDLWGGSPVLFTNDDIDNLAPTDRLPLVMTLDCLNGFFGLLSPPYSSSLLSLSEKFLLSEGKGAIATFSPSGLGYSSDHKIVAERLFSEYLDNNTLELGKLVDKSKLNDSENYIPDYIIDTFVLLGDPALKLKKTEIEEPEKKLPVIESVNKKFLKFKKKITVSGKYFGTSEGKIYLIRKGKRLNTDIVKWKAKKVIFKVPWGASYHKYRIALKTAEGNRTKYETPLVYIKPYPVIDHLSKKSASSGDEIIISGWNFGPEPGKLFFNGRNIDISEWSNSSIRFLVPQTSVKKSTVKVKTMYGKSRSATLKISK